MLFVEILGHHKRLLKKVARQLAGKAPPPKTATPKPAERERRSRYALRWFPFARTM